MPLNKTNNKKPLNKMNTKTLFQQIKALNNKQNSGGLSVEAKKGQPNFEKTAINY